MKINSKNLFGFRKNKGISQKKFAEFLGISTRSYQNYETGVKIPEAKKLLILSKLVSENFPDKEQEETEIDLEEISAKKTTKNLSKYLELLEHNQIEILSRLNKQMDVIQELKKKISKNKK